MTLRVQDLSVSFGGLQALKNLSLEVPPGKLVGIMGPNGAGKTTFFNLVTGVYRPSSGSVRFGDMALHGQTPARVCRAGIARTFQSGRPFGNLTVLENVLTGLFYGADEARPKPSKAERRAGEILEFVDLAGKADWPVSRLNLVDRKMVEVARAVATRPKLLLLDEPLAGLHPLNLVPAIRIVRRIRDELGITVVWVEHIIQVLMETCEHLIVLNHGEKLAEGAPNEVAANPAVAEAYFGKKAQRG